MAAETGSKVQTVLYASGPLDCSVTVTPDEGVTWFGQSLTALDRPVEYAKLEFLTPELGFAAVGTQHSPGGGEEKYAFFTHNGGQSWTAFGALPHFGTSHILSGFSMTPEPARRFSLLPQVQRKTGPCSTAVQMAEPPGRRRSCPGTTVRLHT